MVMRGRYATVIFLVGLFGGTSALAMKMGPEMGGGCHVLGSKKLPARSGGAAGVCTEIERAIDAAAPKARYSAAVRVLSSSRLTATLVVNGRELPNQNFAIMDSELDAAAVRRFAASIASAVAEATKTAR
jgi:hypothetical protein